MPYESSGVNDVLGEIVTSIVGSLSLEQASIRTATAGHKLSGMTISRLKKGMPGLEQTVRAFASAFVDRIYELYGDEVCAAYGACSPTTAANWLAAKAGFGRERQVFDVPAAADGTLVEAVRATVREELRRSAVEAGLAEVFWKNIGELARYYGFAEVPYELVFKEKLYDAATTAEAAQAAMEHAEVFAACAPRSAPPPRRRDDPAQLLLMFLEATDDELANAVATLSETHPELVPVVSERLERLRGCALELQPAAEPKEE